MTPSPDGSFARYFLTEMYRNAALVLLVMVATVLGLWAGSAFGDEVAPVVGLAIGLAAGIALARAIYRRTHR